jgi:hypothetical protein
MAEAMETGDGVGFHCCADCERVAGEKHSQGANSKLSQSSERTLHALCSRFLITEVHATMPSAKSLLRLALKTERPIWS